MIKASVARSMWCRCRFILVVAGLVAFFVGSYFVLSVVSRVDQDELESGHPEESLSPNAKTAAIPDQPFGILTTAESQQQRRADDETFAPESDTWKTEVLAESAKKQLLRILQPLAHPRETISAEQLAATVAPNFSGQALRPGNLRKIAGDAYFSISRGPGGNDATSGKVRHGSEGLVQLLRELAAPLKHAENIQLHIKVYEVSAIADSITTKVDFEANGQVDGGTIQQNATWTCRWTQADGGPLRLLSIHATDYEEVVGRAKDGTWFVDCTESALSKNRSHREQLAFGLNHWLRRIERVHRMQVYARTGLAVGDVNGDGLDDVYLCQPAGLPNRLYVQNSDGTATDSSQLSGVDWLDETHGALLVDLDNDGDQDLALACTAGILLMENDSTGRFRVRQRLEIERSVESLSAVDYDNDGDLDLYNCVYRADPGARHAGSAPEFVYHDANDGGVNRLFRNDLADSADNAWRFTDVTRECGLDSANRRWSLAASWEDFDNDGDQDLYVANDYGQNCLYRNDNGQFHNVAGEMDVVDFGSGMSVSWGDLNHDGWMDLYVGNMFSAAGNRIATQEPFMTRSDKSTRSLLRRFAKGNSLFQNIGGEHFREVGAEAAVELARWAWSSLFVDVNNDGWEDLLVANGFITADDDRDL